jgi:tagatose 1,6-diphosphate aldolase
MTSKLTAGKLAGLKAVSNHRGVIAAAAMDQRGSLQPMCRPKRWKSSSRSSPRC